MREPKGKRVLMLLENATYPSDERVRHEAVTLLAGGYYVAVISPMGKGQSKHEVLNGIDVYRFPYRARFKWISWLFLGVRIFNAGYFSIILICSNEKRL